MPSCVLVPAVLAVGRPAALTCEGLAPGSVRVDGLGSAVVGASGRARVVGTPTTEGAWALGVHQGGAVVATVEATVAPAYGPGPEWLDRTFYVLIPGKFANGDPANDVMLQAYPPTPGVTYGGGYAGGDLAGALRDADHVLGLGLNTVLLYPPFANDRGWVPDLAGTRWLASGYRVRDWTAVDENLGTAADLAALVNALHAGAMDVVVDLPLTLSGLEHPFAADPVRPAFLRPWVAGDSIAPAPMVMWRGTPDERRVDNGWGMPMVDLSVPWVADAAGDVMDALIDAGADGFRYDSVQNGPGDTWRALVARAETRRPETVHLGEVVQLVQLSWQAAYADYLAPQTVGGTGVGFDGIYDLAMTDRIQAVFAEDVDATTLADHHHLEVFFNGADAARMVGSVDLYEDPTFLDRVVDAEGSARLRGALVALFALDRVPMVFSGDELGVAYAAPDLLAYPDADPAVLDTLRALATLRRDEPALRRGVLGWLEERPDFLAWSRGDELVATFRPGPVAGWDLVDLPPGCAGLVELLTTGDGTSAVAMVGPARALVQHAAHEARVFRCSP
ncbi:MAG: hypothetical protein H6738_21585 [Alphaproteobacteria bacterium]|nr:hypothetical protein [Alphaproteobacteria bacterium]MCB9699389.1 hypothetical protein [Alphaproteobacteria bacterium]